MPELQELSKEYEGRGVAIKGIVVESGSSGMLLGLSSEEEWKEIIEERLQMVK